MGRCGYLWSRVVSRGGGDFWYQVPSVGDTQEGEYSRIDDEYLGPMNMGPAWEVGTHPSLLTSSCGHQNM